MTTVRVAVLKYNAWRREDSEVRIIVSRDAVAETKALAAFVREQLDDRLEKMAEDGDDMSDAAIARLITNDAIDTGRGIWELSDEGSGPATLHE